MRPPDELVEQFRRNGLKATPQRVAVFRALHGDLTHPTAEAVHARVVADLPTVSLRTVYQVLGDLAEMGEILHLDLGTGSGRFDPRVEAPHHHVVCTSCGMVRDLEGGPALLHTADLPAGFTPHSTEVTVRGLCAGCAAAVRREGPVRP